MHASCPTQVTQHYIPYYIVQIYVYSKFTHPHNTNSTMYKFAWYNMYLHTKHASLYRSSYRLFGIMSVVQLLPRYTNTAANEWERIAMELLQVHVYLCQKIAKSLKICCQHPSYSAQPNANPRSWNYHGRNDIRFRTDMWTVNVWSWLSFMLENAIRKQRSTERNMDI